MREATKEEIQKYTTYTIVVSFKNPNGKNKNVTTKNLKGDSLENLKQEILTQTKQKFPLGKDFYIKDCYDSFDNQNGFFWDWKQLPDEDFWKQLDKQLKPFNAEIVYYPFDGDAYQWFVGPIL